MRCLRKTSKQLLTAGPSLLVLSEIFCAAAQSECGSNPVKAIKIP